MKPKLPSSASGASPAPLRLKVRQFDTITLLALNYENSLADVGRNDERARGRETGHAEAAAAPIVAIVAENPLALARARAQLLPFLVKVDPQTGRQSIRLEWLTLSPADIAQARLQFADLTDSLGATVAARSDDVEHAPELAQVLADPWLSGGLITHPDAKLVDAWVAVIKLDGITTVAADEQDVELADPPADATEARERPSAPHSVLRIARHASALLATAASVAVLLRTLGLI